ncbi:hypothetical protein BDF22DRAFT_673810 [Syncephalis plumigaleata]|nr:hypothetical protein BDF22DRAFT_673810 [Syncephalis plumigaleata]
MLQAIRSTNNLGARPLNVIAKTLPSQWIQRAGLAYVARPQKPRTSFNDKQSKADTLSTEGDLVAAYAPFRLTSENKQTLDDLCRLSNGKANEKHVKVERFPSTAICLNALQKREKLFKRIEDDFSVQEAIVSVLKAQNTRQISLMTLIQLLQNDQQFKENTTLQNLLATPASFHQWFLGSTQNDVFSISEMGNDSTTKDTTIMDPEKINVLWSGQLLSEREKNGILYQVDKYIITFVDPEVNIRFDMTLHNFLPVYNSKLIRQYVSNNPQITTFLLAIKYWSRQRQLVDSLHHNGVLTSYAHVMMGLQFLLSYGIIRPLQLTCSQHSPNRAQHKQLLQGVIREDVDQETGDNTKKRAQPRRGPRNYVANTPITECIVCNRTLGTYNYERPFTYFTDSKSQHQTSNNHMIAELLIEFFRYYAFEFPYLDDCVSVRLGHPIRREAKDWGSGRSTATRDPYGFAAGLCIEDPFELEYNLSGNANRWEVAGLRWEYERAYHALLSGRGFAGACLPWKSCDPARFYDLGIYHHEIVTRMEK